MIGLQKSIALLALISFVIGGCGVTAEQDAQSNQATDSTNGLTIESWQTGNGSWFFADFYPELFSAAIPMASSYDPARSSGEVPAIEIPLYVIHGEDDELFPLAETQAFVNESIDAGSSIEFVVATGLSHLDVCDYTSYLQDAVTWVQTEIWD